MFLYLNFLSQLCRRIKTKKMPEVNDGHAPPGGELLYGQPTLEPYFYSVFLFSFFGNCKAHNYEAESFLICK